MPKIPFFSRNQRWSNAAEEYHAVCAKIAGEVIAWYSTSFSLATGLLPRQMKRDISNLYGMVRIADEIVDGGAQELEPAVMAKELHRFEQDVYHGIELGFSANPIIDAFATTARACDIKHEHIHAFFRSMEDDLPDTGAQLDLGEYIYGSAEVIGLMCVDVFLRGTHLPEQQYAVVQDGARRLGAAFQKINFLRDLHEDQNVLGRHYFGEALDEDKKNEIVAEVLEDLDAAYASTAYLPQGARVGVLAATYLYAELTTIIGSTPLSVLSNTRVSVAQRRKLLLSAKALSDARTLTPNNPRPAFWRNDAKS